MRGPQAAIWICVLNAGLLLGGGAAALGLFRTLNDELDRGFDAPSAHKAAPIAWDHEFRRGNGGSLAGLDASMLSPVARPKTGAGAVDTGPVVTAEPTDDELRAELEKWLHGKFSLKRAVLSSVAADSCAFFVVPELGAKADSVFLPNGADFEKYFANHGNAALRVLAKYKITFKVTEEGAILNAPSLRRPDKRFDICLGFAEGTSRIPDNGINRKPTEPSARIVPMPGGPSPADDVPHYERLTDTWTLARGDLDALKSDDLAQYVKVLVAADGRPLGLQVSENLPSGHVAAQRGLKPGDVIKAVNGHAVRSLADVRSVVKREHDAGVRTFEVLVEREGAPVRKTFKAPQ